MKFIALLLFSISLGASLWLPGSVVDNYKIIVISKDSVAYLNIPRRPANAIAGSEFARQVAGLKPEEREKALVREILNGNIPSFSRELCPLTIRESIGDSVYTLTFFVTGDYMAIGPDQDYLYIPMTPSAAQYLANRLECVLPTKKMVDMIYRKAEIKLRPQPIPPSDKMTTIPVFEQHTDSIRQQMSKSQIDRQSCRLIAGHKKDIIISNKIYSADREFDRVVIYGWHRGIDDPIQPVYNGHDALYADYSHGVRLISDTAILNGKKVKIDEIFMDSGLSGLLSDEGVIIKPYYPGIVF